MSVNAINSLIVWRIIAISVLCLQTRPCKTNAFPSKSFLRCMNCIRFRKVIENSVPIAHLSIDHDMVNMTRPITAYIYVDCSSLSSHRCLLEILVSTFLPTAYLSDCIHISVHCSTRPLSLSNLLEFIFTLCIIVYVQLVGKREPPRYCCSCYPLLFWLSVLFCIFYQQ